MTTAYTSLLGLALPVQGELTGVWGDTVNNSITSLLDTSVAGTTNVSTDTDVTLTTTTGAANTARQAILLFSGARTALRTVTAPAQSKIYTVINATTGGFSVKLVGSGPTTGLTIPNGASAVVAWNGSDFVEVGAGSIGNLVVNGTLTVTGATTLQSTLAVTGNITNTAGTANGVAYLNGSKVVTSGSALTFSGANLGVGTASASQRVHIYESTAATGAFLQVQEVGGQNAYFGVNTSGGSIQVAGANPLQFAINGSEQMRLTSTGLGIGTSSPAYKLDVSGSARIGTGTTTPSLLTMYPSASAKGWQISANNYVASALEFTCATANGGTTFSTPSMLLDSSGNLGIGTSSPADILTLAGGASGSYGLTINNAKVGGGTKAIFQYDATNAIALVGGNTTNGLAFQTLTGGSLTTKATLDSSGNLGLGVTPSAWSGGYVGFQVKDAAFASYSSGYTWVGNNWYNNAGNKYIGTGYATLYEQNAGKHVWSTAASGTAGNAITFTQAMTLDASGRLGVGTTSPLTPLQINSFGGFDGNGNQFYLTNNQYYDPVDARDESIKAGFSNRIVLDNNSGGILFQTTSTSAAGANTAVTLSERARITSGGYFKASNTANYYLATGAYHELQSSTSSTQIATFSNSSVDPYGVIVRFTGAAPNSTDNWFFYCDDSSGAQRASIKSNGGLYNYQANDSNLSDRREKTNFAPAKSYLDVICAIPVQTFNYIDQNLEEDGGLTLGVVAQDVQAVAPELVMESNWAKEGDEPKMRLSIYQTDLQYALMKCIQEQQAIIESLKARLDAANL